MRLLLCFIVALIYSQSGLCQGTQSEHKRGSIAATSHVICLRSNGKVYAAGESNDGARGDADEAEFRLEFQEVVGLPTVRSVAASENCSAALAEDGTVWVWGMFDYLTPYHQPKKINGLDKVKQIAAGSNFIVALREDGSVVVAGSSDYGLRGSIDSVTEPGTFTLIDVGTDNVAVGATLSTAFVVKKNGSVWGWGSKSGSILGKNARWSLLDPDLNPTPKPIQVVGLQNIVAVEGGHHHALALDKNGDVYGWGDNEDFELAVPQIMGFGETYYQYPAKCKGLPKIAAIEAGYGYSMALDQDGQVWTWGSNTYGCLGVPDEFEYGREKPAKVKNISKASSIHAGDYLAFAVLNDMKIVGWGSNTPGGNFISKTVTTEIIPPTSFSIP